MFVAATEACPSAFVRDGSGPAWVKSSDGAEAAGLEMLVVAAGCACVAPVTLAAVAFAVFEVAPCVFALFCPFPAAAAEF